MSRNVKTVKAIRNERRPHLLRVEGGPEPFAPLIAAAREAGLRIGWLELEAPAGLPPGLEAAAAAGVLRAVAVGSGPGGRSVAVKPLRGAAVLRDLLREHFRGCVLVLVAGGGAAPEDLAKVPLLAPAGEDWRLGPAGEPERTLSMGELVAALRRSRPWAVS